MTTARARYSEALAVAVEAITDEPANAILERDVSLSHERLGDEARAVGDIASATDHDQASFDFDERLARTDPTNTEWQRDLSVSPSRVAGAAVAHGGVHSDQQHCMQSLALSRELRARGNTARAQADLKFCLERVVEIAEASGDTAAARRLRSECAALTGTRVEHA